MRDAVSLHVRVTPKASVSEWNGWGVDELGRPVLGVRLKAAPMEGHTNAELIRFAAKSLGCSKGEVRLVRGDTQRIKTLEIPAAAAARLPERACG